MQKPGETIYIIKKEADEIELEEEKSYNFFERVTNWLKEIMPE